MMVSGRCVEEGYSMSGEDCSSVVCPFCSDFVPINNFCASCGKPIPEPKSLVRCCNNFSESDAVSLDKLLYCLGVVKASNEGGLSTSNGNIIRAIGDIENVPADFEGRIYSTGKVVFSDPKEYVAEIGYESPNTHLCVRAAYRKALVIKREGSEIVIQTDVSRYVMHGLGDAQRKMFSRTPIIMMRDAGSMYLLCEKQGAYVFDYDHPLDLSQIYQLAPYKRYRIGNFGYFSV